MLTRIPMLDRDTCAEVLARVHALEPRWISRSATSRFFTLGAASYLDEPSRYRDLAAELNPALDQTFGAVYETLRSALAGLLGAPVVFEPALARPGFHVWGVPGIPTGGQASLHFDLQYLRVSWPDRARPGFARPLSFTLPLRLPRLGGGLSVWDTSYERVNAFFRKTGYSIELDDLTLLLDEQREPYAIGELVVHSGHVLHRIAPVPEVDPDDLRVTLQGHGIEYDGVWHLYW